MAATQGRCFHLPESVVAVVARTGLHVAMHVNCEDWSGGMELMWILRPGEPSSEVNAVANVD